MVRSVAASLGSQTTKNQFSFFFAFIIRHDVGIRLASLWRRRQAIREFASGLIDSEEEKSIRVVWLIELNNK